ncbi:MAG: large subunit ribosomal protein L1 [Candidatus Doudnabacteria bacterium Gr01-1014_77]|uniref:Large ribosomal subunit protein uL1 n=1 Tax=Candidatus Doudnabacteria bacterium Gr01-1014_77 TaxID=2017133 RepID=A0A554J9D4_9BACT|nr:MAG: large subunit ribosomal protein L1 [Candidatus Doudnabacteria bacterium Gr01-1014_77]
MDLKSDLKKALESLRKSGERKFNQTVDLIINLQKFDSKKNQINLFVTIPFKVKEKKIAGFLEVQNKGVETITPEQFKRYSEKKDLKKLVKKFDFFIAQASVMPRVATTFGRVLGPAGKMPSPQLGILMNVNDKEVEELKRKISNSVRIKIKEASIKLAIGKQSMKDEEIIENVISVYNAMLKVLPKEAENVKNIEIKFTMTKPEKIRIR